MAIQTSKDSQSQIFATRAGSTKPDRFMPEGCSWVSVTRSSSCSLTPDWYWNCKTHAVKSSAGQFYNFSTSGSEKSVSEWPVPDLQPIWRVHRAPLHLCIPHERNAAVLFNTTALLNPAGSLGWRLKSRRARKQLKTGTFTHSLCWGGFLWFLCPGGLVFTWNCEGTKDLRTKMAAAQDSSNIFLKTQQSFKTFFFF